MANIDEYKTDLQDKINSNNGVCSVLNCLGISSAKSKELIFSQIEIKDLKIMCLFILYNLDKDNEQYDRLLKNSKYNPELIKSIATETLEKVLDLVKKDKAIKDLYLKTIGLKENRKPKNELINLILNLRKTELTEEEKENMEKSFSSFELEILILYFSTSDYQTNINQIKKIYFVDERYIKTLISKLSNIKSKPKLVQTSKSEPLKNIYDLDFEEQVIKLFSLPEDFDRQKLKKIIDFVSEENLKILIDFYYFEGTKEEMIEKYNTSEENLAINIRHTLSLISERTSKNLPSKGKFKFNCRHYKHVLRSSSKNSNFQSQKSDSKRHVKKAEIICSIYGITDPVLIKKLKIKFSDPQINVFLLFSEFKEVLTDEEILIAKNFAGNSLSSIKIMEKYIGNLVAEDLDMKSRITYSLTEKEKEIIYELIKRVDDTEKIFIFSLLLKLSDRSDVYYFQIAKILNIDELEVRKKLIVALDEVKAVEALKEQGDSSYKQILV